LKQQAAMPMGTMDLVLPDMSCGHCERTVTQAVKNVDPAARLHIDLARKQVHIESDQPAQLFKTALADAGYPPQPRS
jgi:copper chaperone